MNKDESSGMTTSEETPPMRDTETPAFEEVEREETPSGSETPSSGDRGKENAENETETAVVETETAVKETETAGGDETMISATSISSWEEERRQKALDRLCLLGDVESNGSEVQIIKSRRRRIIRAALWSVASVLSTLSLACGAGIVYIRATTDEQLWQAKQTKSRVVDGIWIDNEGEDCRNPAFYKVNFEPVVIPIKDGGGVLKGVFMRQPNKSTEVPTIIWLFGQGNNTGRSLHRMSKLYKRFGCNVLACDYKGMGGSSGEPSEDTLLEHGKLLLEYLTEACSDKVDLGRVFVWGHSLGVCPAVALMADPRCSEKLAGGVFENGFTSLLEMAQRREPLLSPLLKLGLKYKLANVDRIRRVSRPALFLQGDADDVVPPRMTSELFKWCPSATKQIGIVNGGPHSLIDEPAPLFLKNVQAFLDNPTTPKRPIWRSSHPTHPDNQTDTPRQQSCPPHDTHTHTATDSLFLNTIEAEATKTETHIPQDIQSSSITSITAHTPMTDADDTPPTRIDTPSSDEDTSVIEMSLALSAGTSPMSIEVEGAEVLRESKDGLPSLSQAEERVSLSRRGVDVGDARDEECEVEVNTERCDAV